MGRHYEPSERDRTTVKYLAIAGYPAGTIALCLGQSLDTIRRCFRKELDTAEAFATAEVAGNLLLAARNMVIKERRQQVGADGQVRDVEVVTGFHREGVVAGIFWMKTHGWRYSGLDDLPARADSPVLDLTGMAEDRKLMLLELLDEAVAGDEAGPEGKAPRARGGGRALARTDAGTPPPAWDERDGDGGGR